jgi:hypothetical protein
VHDRGCVQDRTSGNVCSKDAIAAAMYKLRGFDCPVSEESEAVRPTAGPIWADLHNLHLAYASILQARSCSLIGASATCACISTSALEPSTKTQLLCASDRAV